MKVVLSGQARADLRAIALHIARDDKQRARSFVRELQSAAQVIGDIPFAFPLVPRFEKHRLRRRPFRDYLIFTVSTTTG